MSPADSRVVVHALSNVHTGRRVDVAGDEGVHVICATMSRFDHQTEIWGKTTAKSQIARVSVSVNIPSVPGTRSFVIRVRRRHIVCEFSTTE